MKTIVLAAAIATAFVTPALAQTRVDPITVSPGRTAVVSYADLDIDHPDGMRALNGRLRAAARSVCGEPSRLIQVEALRVECFNQAMRGAQAELAAQRQFAEGPKTILLAAANPER